MITLYFLIAIVFRSDRASANKTHGAGVLIALSSRVRPYNCRYDLESCGECVWVEISTSDCFNSTIGNHLFPPDPKPAVIANWFRFLGNKLGVLNFRHDSTVLRASRLSKSHLKVSSCHIPLLISTTIDGQAFKTVDEDCCASVL
jgi:hypothetical protein